MNCCCSICLDPLGAARKIVSGPCGHVFHRKCIKDWLALRTGGARHCPICRKNIPDDSDLKMIYLTFRKETCKRHSSDMDHELELPPILMKWKATLPKNFKMYLIAFLFGALLNIFLSQWDSQEEDAIEKARRECISIAMNSMHESYYATVRRFSKYADTSESSSESHVVKFKF